MSDDLKPTEPSAPPQPAPVDSVPAAAVGRRHRTPAWRRLLSDPVATAAAVFLLFTLVIAVIGPYIAHGPATSQDLYDGNVPPFHGDRGFWFLLGGDSLGRSILARLIVGARTTIVIGVCAVALSFLIGSAIGMWAGFHRGWRETLAMRAADVIYSFPSLLLAIVLLYVFNPSPLNVVLVLSFARIPIYLRTARIQAAEIRSRLFVDAARTFGASQGTIVRRHIAPIVGQTLVTVAALDFSRVVLAESALDFLGIGIQSPGITWGLMVSEGRDQLSSAWWLTAFPGIWIVLTTVSATLLANWLRMQADPSRRSRPKRRKRPAATVRRNDA